MNETYNGSRLTEIAWDELEKKYPELNGFGSKEELQEWLEEFGRISRGFLIGRRDPERAFEVDNLILLDPFDS